MRFEGRIIRVDFVEEQLHRGDLIVEQAPEYRDEREARSEAFKAAVGR
jgi:hypothetical protein